MCLVDEVLFSTSFCVEEDLDQSDFTSQPRDLVPATGCGRKPRSLFRRQPFSFAPKGGQPFCFDQPVRPACSTLTILSNTHPIHIRCQVTPFVGDDIQTH